jgi:thioredoxin reductase
VEETGTEAAIESLRSDAMKTSTVDLVVTGDERAALAAAMDAVRRGQRVLVVLRSDDARVVPRLRRLCRAAKDQLTVMTNAEVVCVDGVHRVEAIVVRYTRTRRLCAVNTRAFLSCDGSTNPPRTRIGDMPVGVRKIEAERRS